MRKKKMLSRCLFSVFLFISLSVSGCACVLGTGSSKLSFGDEMRAVGPDVIVTDGKIISSSKIVNTTSTHSGHIPVVVRPVYPLLSPEYALMDGTYAISLGENALAGIDRNELYVTIFDSDHYQSALVESLGNGDFIECHGKSILVNEVHFLPNDGLVLINGGAQNGGISLVKYRTLYRVCDADGNPFFCEVGGLSIPISADFSFRLDTSKSDTSYSLDDFLSFVDENLYDLSYSKTKMTVINGSVSSISVSLSAK